jgi:hypothetical protein
MIGFNLFELVAVAVLIENSISSDGQSNWLEGMMLLASCAVLGIAFYFHPITVKGKRLMQKFRAAIVQGITNKIPESASAQ